MDRSIIVIALIAAAAVAPAPAHASDTPWVRRTIAAGWRGADGVHLADANGDGQLDVATGWEEAGIVTVSLHPQGPATGPWPTVAIATRLFGVEDAVFADVDGDGRLDVVSACECRRIVVHFAPQDPLRYLEPAAWTSVVIAASTGFQRWIKVALADVDGDGRTDIVGGGKVNPASVGWFRAPANPRDGNAWTYAVASPVSWTMSLSARDLNGDGRTDILLSDRSYIINPDGTRRYDLRGSRWLEQTGNGWENRTIGFGGGETKFLHVADYDGDGREDVLDGVSGPTYNKTFLRRNLGQWGPWQETPIPQPGNVGWYQDVKTGDLDGDGDLDLVFSYSHADGGLSGAVWLRRAAGGTYERHEISGPEGTKFDNVELVDVDGDGDLDVITTEQIEQLGIIWYENPR